MITSAPGRELIEAFEGCEAATGNGTFTTYHDSVGVLTIGYGHTNLGNIPPVIHPGDIWTKEQCDSALSADLERFDGYVDALLPNLTQCQHDALSSFDFNTGALARSSIPSKIRAGNIAAAMDTLLLYDHAGGVELRGLTRRRHAERLMFLGDVAGALALAGVPGDKPLAKATMPSDAYKPLAGNIYRRVA